MVRVRLCGMHFAWAPSASMRSSTCAVPGRKAPAQARPRRLSVALSRCSRKHVPRSRRGPSGERGGRTQAASVAMAVPGGVLVRHLLGEMLLHRCEFLRGGEALGRQQALGRAEPAYVVAGAGSAGRSGIPVLSRDLLDEEAAKLFPREEPALRHVDDHRERPRFPRGLEHPLAGVRGQLVRDGGPGAHRERSGQALVSDRRPRSGEARGPSLRFLPEPVRRELFRCARMVPARRHQTPLRDTDSSHSRENTTRSSSTVSSRAATQSGWRPR